MRIVLFSLFTVFLSHSSFAATLPHSAVRKANEDWKVRASIQKSLRGSEDEAPAVDVAERVDQADVSQITVWKDYATILENFKRARDHRFIQDFNHNGLRRSTWLYPDDGCFARAQLVETNFTTWGVGPVKKIFVFGNLNVDTLNSPSGSVTWWYHVAPIVSDGIDNYVIDPAIEPKQPLKLNDWLARMGDVDQMKIAICDSDSYTPYSTCIAPQNYDAANALEEQQYYLEDERNRLQDLGRDDEKELGEFPPWLEEVLNPTLTRH